MQTLYQDGNRGSLSGKVQEPGEGRGILPGMAGRFAQDQSRSHLDCTDLRGDRDREAAEVINSSQIHYAHIKGQRNTYKVLFELHEIGTVRYTPELAKPWTFISQDGRAETYGSTRLQAVGYYVEDFMKRGEG